MFPFFSPFLQSCRETYQTLLVLFVRHKIIFRKDSGPIFCLAPHYGDIAIIGKIWTLYIFLMSEIGHQSSCKNEHLPINSLGSVQSYLVQLGLVFSVQTTIGLMYVCFQCSSASARSSLARFGSVWLGSACSVQSTLEWLLFKNFQFFISFCKMVP